jgi:multiple sugar transport system substrate-binding protein
MQDRTRMRFISLLAVVMLVATAALSQAAVAQGGETIRFAFWGDPAEFDAYQAVADGFEAANPGYDVEIDYTSGQGDYYRKLATDFAAGDPPDVFLTNYRNFGQYPASGALDPIEPHLNASSVFTMEDFYQEPMDAFRYRGGPVVCMPQNISSLVVYYNVDMFEANGVPVPADGWTWDTFIDAAEALTQDTDGDGVVDQFGVVVEPSMYRMVSFIWGAGGEIVDDLDNPTRLTIDTPEARAGIEAFLSLGVMGSNVVPPAEEVAAEADQDRFMRGGAAMFLQSRRPVPTLREIEGFTWDVAALPVINQASTVLHSDAFCMAAGANETGSAWKFIEYAASEQGQLILAATGRTVPSMISVAESDAFLLGIAPDSGTPTGSPVAAEPLPPASSQVYLENIQVMHRLPSISTWPEVEDAFNAEFDQGFYEPVDIDAAIAAAIENAQAALDRSAEEDGV